MLPILKKKYNAGLIVETRKPDADKPQDNKDDKGSRDAAIKSCADRLIQGIHNNDSNMVASAIRDAFDILESMPHEEGEHKSDGGEIEETSHSIYDAQNVKAAK